MAAHLCPPVISIPEFKVFRGMYYYPRPPQLQVINQVDDTRNCTLDDSRPQLPPAQDGCFTWKATNNHQRQPIASNNHQCSPITIMTEAPKMVSSVESQRRPITTSVHHLNPIELVVKCGVLKTKFSQEALKRGMSCPHYPLCKSPESSRPLHLLDSPMMTIAMHCNALVTAMSVNQSKSKQPSACQ